MPLGTLKVLLDPAQRGTHSFPLELDVTVNRFLVGNQHSMVHDVYTKLYALECITFSLAICCAKLHQNEEADAHLLWLVSWA